MLGLVPPASNDVLYLTCLCAETKCHSRDPKPTVLDPSDPKAKQTYVPPSETFDEYMKRRAAQAGKKQELVQARPAASASGRVGSSKGYSAMYLR